MTQPGDLSDELVAELRAHFTAEQLVEITLKVMKFNVQKVMVALGTHEWMTAETLDDAKWNADGLYVAAS
jgi:hypothetical protein